MWAALTVGGTTRLKSTSTAISPSTGVAVARMKSGPTVNSGWGRAARNTWAGAAAGPAVTSSPASSRARLSAIDLGAAPSDAHRREHLDVVLFQGQALLDHAVLEEAILHGPEGLHAEGSVLAEEGAGDLVGGERGRHAPAQLLGHDLDGVRGLRSHEALGAEHGPHHLADLILLPPDALLGGVLDLADPAGRHPVQP